MKLFNLLLASTFAVSLNACKAESTTTTQEKTAMTESITETNITELKKIDTQVGTGREAEPGFNISVHYTGWLYDAAATDKKGKKFDSSLDRKQPFDFALGAGQVIQGLSLIHIS